MNGKRVCLFLDELSIFNLDKLRGKTIKPKSEIVRKLLIHFGKDDNLEELQTILAEE